MPVMAKGRSLLASTSASDYAHLIAACLFHDIGFVRGILTGDGEDGYVIDADGGRVKLLRGSSDAALIYVTNMYEVFGTHTTSPLKISCWREPTVKFR
jgi:hypothetical protein